MAIAEKQHFFLSGSVGVGKTTALKTFMDTYGGAVNCYLVQEYIDFDEEGEARLNSFQKGDTSLFDFQVYIIDMLEKQLTSKEYAKARFIIWERHPEEALEIFSVDMDEEHRKSMDDRLKSLSISYHFPMLSERNKFMKLTFNTLDISDIFIADVIYDTIKSLASVESQLFNPKAVYVFLYIPNYDVRKQFERICDRGRKCEVATYKDLVSLCRLNTRYLKFIDTIGK